MDNNNNSNNSSSNNKNGLMSPRRGVVPAEREQNIRLSGGNNSTTVTTSTSPKLSYEPVYHPLAQLERLLLQKGGLELVGALAAVMPLQDQDELATELVILFGYLEEDITLIKWAISLELAVTDTQGTLFRGAGLPQKLTSVYSRNWGLVYLFHVLDPTIEEICCGADIEIDPMRLKPGDDLARNQARFIKIAGRVLEDICKSADQCPVALKVLYEYIQDETVKRFPEMKYKIIGGFYFLRFVCPALITPEAFDIRNNIDDKSRRCLILLSKFLQNLSSNQPFGDKETYMCCLNETMKQQLPKLYSFFNQLVQVPTEKKLELPKNKLLTEELSLSALVHLRKQFHTYLPKIKANLQTKNKSEVQPALQRLENILAAPLPERNDSDVALIQTHRNLMKSELQDNIAAHGEEIEKLREHRRLLRKESNLQYVRDMEAKKGGKKEKKEKEERREEKKEGRKHSGAKAQGHGDITNFFKLIARGLNSPDP